VESVVILKQWTALRIVEEGGQLPRGYGVAYWLPYSEHAVLAPLGVHLIISYTRRLYYWLIHTRAVEPWEGYAAYQHSKGFAAGLEHGREQGLRIGIMMARAER